jgi:hypothetical protein
MRADSLLAYPHNRRRAGLRVASACSALVAVSAGLIMGLYIRTSAQPPPSHREVVAATAGRSVLHQTPRLGSAPWAANSDKVTPWLISASQPEFALPPKDSGKSGSDNDQSSRSDDKSNSTKNDSASSASNDGANNSGAGTSAPASVPGQSPTTVSPQAAQQYVPPTAPQTVPRSPGVLAPQQRVPVPAAEAPQVVPQGPVLAPGQTTALVPVPCPASVTGALCYQTTTVSGGAPATATNPSAPPDPRAASPVGSVTAPTVPTSSAPPFSTTTADCQMSGKTGDFSYGFMSGMAGLGKLITNRLKECMKQQPGAGTGAASTDSGQSQSYSGTAVTPSERSSGAAQSAPGLTVPVPAAPAPAPVPTVPCPSGSSSAPSSRFGSSSGSQPEPASGSGQSAKKDQSDSDDTRTSGFIGPTLAARSVTGCATSVGSSAVDGTSSATSAALSKIPTGPTKQLKIWLTGYSYQDNTPPGSATVSAPLLHQKAGGTGTFTDPITVAAPGHNDGSGMGFAPATRFYLPSVQRYVIVEDSGASPAPSGTDGHLDMWVDGEGGGRSASDDCMNRITSTSAEAIENPQDGLPVTPGPITKDGQCNLPGGAASSASSGGSEFGDSK